MKKLNHKSFLMSAVLTLFAAQTFGQSAQLQVIHNSSDPNAAKVDVYVNGILTLDDFAFRKATPFLTWTAGINLNIGVAPGNSTSVNDTLKNFSVTLASGNRYIAIVNGVLNPINFASNPDGKSTGLTLFLKNNIRDKSNGGDVDFVAVHGSSDAPKVDVIARTVATLVNDASYGDITSYISVRPSKYVLDVTPAAGSPIVASFEADLSSLGGGSAVVFASGFLTPSTNQNGPSFGLFAALANGAVVAFPSTNQARLQVIHNAADPSAASVDVYVNGAKLLDNFAFRNATPYIFVPAGIVLNIGIAAGTSTSVNDTLKNFAMTLQNGNSYVAIANGVLNSANFAVNPDGKSTAFTLFIKDQMRETANKLSEVDLRVVHGATDAPTVDILAGTSPLVNDAQYTNITSYLSVPPSSYILNITPGNDNSNIVASFAVNLSTLGGGAAVVVASGFLNPAINQNGSAFALLGVLPDGTVLLFNNSTSGIRAKNEAKFNIYPNPANDYVQINFAGNTTKSSLLTISNNLSQEVKSEIIPTGISSYTLKISDLPKGVYFINSTDGKSVSNQKLIIK